MGPRLDGVGTRMTSAWIRAFLADPMRYKPDVVMPVYGLSEGDLDALTALLGTWKEVGFGHTPMAALGVAELGLGAPPADAARAALASALAGPVEESLGIPARGAAARDLDSFLGALRREEIDVLLANPLQAVAAAVAVGYQPLAVTAGPPESFVIVGVPGGDAGPGPEQGPLALVRAGDLADAAPGLADGILEGRDVLVFGDIGGAVGAVLAGRAGHALIRERDLDGLTAPVRRRLSETARFRARPLTVLLVRGTTPYRLAARERTVLLGLFGPGEGDRPAAGFSPAREPREGDFSLARTLLPRIRPATGGADPLLVWR